MTAALQTRPLSGADTAVQALTRATLVNSAFLLAEDAATDFFRSLDHDNFLSWLGPRSVDVSSQSDLNGVSTNRLVPIAKVTTAFSSYVIGDVLIYDHENSQWTKIANTETLSSVQVTDVRLSSELAAVNTTGGTAIVKATSSFVYSGTTYHVNNVYIWDTIDSEWKLLTTDATDSDDTIIVFQRAASGTTPTIDVGVLAGSTDIAGYTPRAGWSKNVPSGTDPLWGLVIHLTYPDSIASGGLIPFSAAAIHNLTQAQAEDAASDVFGAISGEILDAVVAGKITALGFDDGVDGAEGGTPRFSVHTNGERRVLQLEGYTVGSVFTAQVSATYVGASGYVTNVAQAVDIRGPTAQDGDDGDPGDEGGTPRLSVHSDGTRRVLQLEGFTAGSTFTPQSPAMYLGASGYTSQLSEAIDLRGPAGSDATNRSTEVSTVDTPQQLAAILTDNRVAIARVTTAFGSYGLHDVLVYDNESDSWEVLLSATNIANAGTSGVTGIRRIDVDSDSELQGIVTTGIVALVNITAAFDSYNTGDVLVYDTGQSAWERLVNASDYEQGFIDIRRYDINSQAELTALLTLALGDTIVIAKIITAFGSYGLNDVLVYDTGQGAWEVLVNASDYSVATGLSTVGFSDVANATQLSNLTLTGRVVLAKVTSAFDSYAVNDILIYDSNDGSWEILVDASDYIEGVNSIQRSEVASQIQLDNLITTDRVAVAKITTAFGSYQVNDVLIYDTESSSWELLVDASDHDSPFRFYDVDSVTELNNITTEDRITAVKITTAFGSYQLNDILIWDSFPGQWEVLVSASDYIEGVNSIERSAVNSLVELNALTTTDRVALAKVETAFDSYGLNDILIYDTENDSWEVLVDASDYSVMATSLNLARSDVTTLDELNALEINNTLALAKVTTAFDSYAVNDILVYDSIDNSWEILVSASDYEEGLNSIQRSLVGSQSQLNALVTTDRVAIAKVAIAFGTYQVDDVLIYDTESSSWEVIVDASDFDAVVDVVNVGNQTQLNAINTLNRVVFARITTSFSNYDLGEVLVYDTVLGGWDRLFDISDYQIGIERTDVASQTELNGIVTTNRVSIATITTAFGPYGLNDVLIYDTEDSAWEVLVDASDYAATSISLDIQNSNVATQAELTALTTSDYVALARITADFGTYFAGDILIWDTIADAWEVLVRASDYEEGLNSVERSEVSTLVELNAVTITDRVAIAKVTTAFAPYAVSDILIYNTVTLSWQLLVDASDYVITDFLSRVSRTDVASQIELNTLVTLERVSVAKITAAFGSYSINDILIYDSVQQSWEVLLTASDYMEGVDSIERSEVATEAQLDALTTDNRVAIAKVTSSFSGYGINDVLIFDTENDSWEVLVDASDYTVSGTLSSIRRYDVTSLAALNGLTTSGRVVIAKITTAFDPYQVNDVLIYDSAQNRWEILVDSSDYEEGVNSIQRSEVNSLAELNALVITDRVAIAKISTAFDSYEVNDILVYDTESSSWELLIDASDYAVANALSGIDFHEVATQAALNALDISNNITFAKITADFGSYSNRDVLVWDTEDSQWAVIVDASDHDAPFRLYDVNSLGDLNSINTDDRVVAVKITTAFGSYQVNDILIWDTFPGQWEILVDASDYSESEVDRVEVNSLFALNALPRDGRVSFALVTGAVTGFGIGDILIYNSVVNTWQVLVDASDYEVPNNRGAVFVTRNRVASTGTSHVLTVPGVASYEDGDTYRFRTEAAGTGEITLDINGIGSRQFLQVNTSEFVSGGLENNTLVIATYIESFDAFISNVDSRIIDLSEAQATDGDNTTIGTVSGEVLQAVVEAFRHRLLTVDQASDPASIIQGVITGQILNAVVQTRHSLLKVPASDVSGTANAIQLAIPAVTQLEEGVRVGFYAEIDNTGNITLQINSLGIKSLRKSDGNLLLPGDIRDGYYIVAHYDHINDRFISDINPDLRYPHYADDVVRTGNLITLQVNNAGTLRDGLTLKFISGATNSGDMTLQIEAGPALELRKSDDSQFDPGEFPDGSLIEITYIVDLHRWISDVDPIAESGISDVSRSNVGTQAQLNVLSTENRVGIVKITTAFGSYEIDDILIYDTFSGTWEILVDKSDYVGGLNHVSRSLVANQSELNAVIITDRVATAKAIAAFGSYQVNDILIYNTINSAWEVLVEASDYGLQTNSVRDEHIADNLDTTERPNFREKIDSDKVVAGSNIIITNLNSSGNEAQTGQQVVEKQVGLGEIRSRLLADFPSAPTDADLAKVPVYNPTSGVYELKWPEPPTAFVWMTGQTERIPSGYRSFPLDEDTDFQLLSFTGTINEHLAGGNSLINITWFDLDSVSDADWDENNAEANSGFSLGAGKYTIKCYVASENQEQSGTEIRLIKVQSGSDDVLLFDIPGYSLPRTNYNFEYEGLTVLSTDIFYFILTDVILNVTGDEDDKLRGFMTIKRYE